MQSTLEICVIDINYLIFSEKKSRFHGLSCFILPVSELHLLLPYITGGSVDQTQIDFSKIFFDIPPT